MKIEDLRIGNLVSVNNKQFHPNLKGAILRVTGLHERSRNGVVETSVNLECERETYSQFMEYIKPVALTEQWLLDLGFNQIIEKQWYLHFHDVCLTLYEDSEQYMVQIHDMEIDESSIFLKSIQYVHQLQNIFFILSGKEIDIKL